MRSDRKPVFRASLALSMLEIELYQISLPYDRGRSGYKINTLLENIDKGLLTGLIFFDLSKAFDTLDHSIMLDKLALLGMNRSAVQWFRSYLTTRPQSVCVNGLLFEPQSIPFGVPQGSVLGP